MKNKDVITRIMALIKYLGISNNAFAKEIRFNQSNFSKIMRGEREVPSNLIVAIMETYAVNKSWLLTGQGGMFREGVTPMKDAEVSEYTTTKKGMEFLERSDGQIIMRVPLVPISVLGSPPDDYATLIEDGEWEMMSFLVDGVHHGRYYAFRVDGDSMDDGTRESFARRDIVLVRELDRSDWLPRLHFSDWPYWVVAFGNNIRLKQITAQDDRGNITLHSLNPSPEYTDFTLPLDSVTHLFNVIQHIPHPHIYKSSAK